jgi:hypothetical protein
MSSQIALEMMVAGGQNSPIKLLDKTYRVKPPSCRGIMEPETSRSSLMGFVGKPSQAKNHLVNAAMWFVNQAKSRGPGRGIAASE